MSARKKNSANHRVRDLYRQDDLTRILTMPEQEFGTAFGMKTVKVDPPARKYASLYSEPADYYHFRDNGASVLAVAHLDTVVAPNRRKAVYRTSQNGPFVVSGSLDDRLGAYVITHLLPALDVSCDWLFTVGEEQADSTAAFFDPQGKDYDHVIEFDRGGTDVVMYQYEDAASRQAVKESGARMGQGSFSDIAYLEHLGVKAFNWGAGYGGNYHSEKGYAFLYDTFAMVARYQRFYALNLGKPMPHVQEEPDYWYSSSRKGSQDYDDEHRCWACDAYAVNLETGYCKECTRCQGCGEHEDACFCYLPASAKRKSELPAVEDGYGNSWTAGADASPRITVGAELND